MGRKVGKKAGKIIKNYKLGMYKSPHFSVVLSKRKRRELENCEEQK